jgi:hypothetical protein
MSKRNRERERERTFLSPVPTTLNVVQRVLMTTYLNKSRACSNIRLRLADANSFTMFDTNSAMSPSTSDRTRLLLLGSFPSSWTSLTLSTMIPAENNSRSRSRALPKLRFASPSPFGSSGNALGSARGFSRNMRVACHTTTTHMWKVG